MISFLADFYFEDIMTNHLHDNDRPPVPILSIEKGITPFFFSSARGRLIRLDSLANVMLERHHYPTCITKLGGEALALVAGLASSLKFEGSFSLQIKGEGVVSMLVADCTHEGALRFYIRYDAEKIQKLPDNTSAKALFEKGLFALTIDQLDKKDTYQGMVEITGETLSEMAEHYFQSSEQFPCWIRLACEKNEQGWQASGLILEKIANDNSIILQPKSNNIEEDWETITILANTLTAQELFNKELTSEQLLYRLFNSVSFTLGQTKPVSYGCRCSRSRLYNILNNFTTDELNNMEQKGDIIMTCEFCNYDFIFPRNEIHGK